jgi:hypothetical protein
MKVKYYYDSENLAYRKIKHKREKICVVILFILAAALFGFEFYRFIEHAFLKHQKTDYKPERLKI